MSESKIIIRNQSQLSDLEAASCVMAVMSNGRVSGDNHESYCYMTKFKDGTQVHAKRNSSSDTFIVWSAAHE